MSKADAANWAWEVEHRLMGGDRQLQEPARTCKWLAAAVRNLGAKMKLTCSGLRQGQTTPALTTAEVSSTTKYNVE